MMQQLKPCPFCESKEVELCHTKPYWVQCLNPDCGMEGPWDLGKSGAVEKWNTRPMEIFPNKSFKVWLKNYDPSSFQTKEEIKFARAAWNAASKWLREAGGG